MTILIALGVWTMIVALTIRFCQHLHACDIDMRDLTAGERVQTWRREHVKHAGPAVRPKRRLSGSRLRLSKPSAGHSSVAPAAG